MRMNIIYSRSVFDLFEKEPNPAGIKRFFFLVVKQIVPGNVSACQIIDKMFAGKFIDIHGSLLWAFTFFDGDSQCIEVDVW